MIRCENLSVKLGKKSILQDLSLSFTKGKITVVLGKNGSGKTTLLKAADKTLPYNGNILINGRNLKGISHSELAKMLSLMPQTLPMPHVTVAKLVSFGRSPYTGISGIPSPTDTEKIQKAMVKANCVELSNSFVDKLSGGERRRVFFAMLLAQDTDTVLLDEPTSNLDSSYKKEVLRLIKEVCAAGKTVVTVLHDINDALETADRIAVLDCGRLIFEGSPDEFEAMQIPQRIFGAKKITATDEDGNTINYYR